MTQVLVTVPLDKFVHALNHARRRFPLVDKNCLHEGTIAIKIAEEFRRVYKQAFFGKVMGTNPVHHKRNLEEFYRRHCVLRLAIGTGQIVHGGYCILGGELMGLWNVNRQHGDWMIRDALHHGADRCDYYDVPALADLYQRNGFTEILREANTNPGGPDVVWARYEKPN